MADHPHIFEFTPDSLREWCLARGLKPFRADQVLDWVYAKGVADPAAMTNLSALDRQTLADQLTFLAGAEAARQEASDGTRKLLIEWPVPSEAPAGAGTPLPIRPRDLRRTECVMIPSDDRRTACISSQVGCPVGCRFCASGVGGLEGNLSAGQIVEQVWRLDRLVKAPPSPAPGGGGGRVREAGGGSDRARESGGSGRARARESGGGGRARERGGIGLSRTPAPGSPPPRPPRITNVVFMGMGEPLANLGNVVRAVRTLAAPWGMGISARKITISTVGLPRAIERLADELDLPVTLALSLHAPTDEIRRRLIPWAEHATIRELLDACQKWFDKTGREITLEYTLLRGVNDRPEHAEQLARLARTLRANVNLIRYNEVPGMPFQRPRSEDVLEFQSILRERHVNTHIRASRGRDIAAACGQLRHELRTARAPCPARKTGT